MGPLCRTRWFQETLQFFPYFHSSNKSSSLVITRRGNGTSPETGSGKCSRSWNSWFLFLAISSPEKEWKVTSCNRSFSIESVHKETTFQDGDSQGVVRCDKGVEYLTSLGHPTDTGL